jgi:hypothetical protein
MDLIAKLKNICHQNHTQDLEKLGAMIGMQKMMIL